MSLLREFCAENMERVPAAVAAGAERIELCDNLAVGGTSPSAGVIRAAVAFARSHGVTVMSMARPRGGDFLYTAAERQIMEDDIAFERAAGVTGVVFGCLSADDETGELVIDRDMTTALVRIAKDVEGEGNPVQVTFHMAFDSLSENRQHEAIDVLISLGVERVLTHGGAAGTPIMDNIEHLKRLIAYADGRIAILPGGGITHANAEEVADALGVSEVHGTKIVEM